MLPFLKRDKEASVSTAPDAIVRKPDDGEPYDVMHSVADDLLHAIERKNIKLIAETLRAAFELLESEEHEEHGEI